MTSRTSVASLVAGFVLCCSLSVSPVRGGESTIRVLPAVRQVAEADDDTTVTTVGWRRFGHYHGHGWGPGYHYHGWGPRIGWGARRYGFYRSYPSVSYYSGYAPYYYSAPVYRTTYYYTPTYYAPTYYAPSYYAPSYTVGYAPVVYSYRPVYYYRPSVRVLYGGYGYYYPGYY
jgi:hypothetical protein